MSDSYPPEPPQPPPGGGFEPPAPPPQPPPAAGAPQYQQNAPGYSYRDQLPGLPPEPGQVPPPMGAAPQPPPNMFGVPTGQKAGFGPRLGAWLLDGLIFGIGFGVVAAAVTFFLARVVLPTEIDFCTDQGRAALCEGPTDGSWVVIILALLALGLALLYLICHMDGTKGGTPGKQMMGIRIVDANTGQFIGKGRALGRNLGRIISQIPFYLGYLWMLWDKDNQTWHDKMVNAIVVKSP